MRHYCASLILGFLLSPTALADQSDQRLDGLFERLLHSEDIASIRAIENQIWEIWLQHPNSDLERLMEIGTQRMNRQSYADALLIFTQIVESFPDYAEGWNKRATLYYLLGNFEASIADIEKTLALEPRHFGALSGLGLVYIQQRELSKAKEAFEDLMAIHPNSPNARQNLEFVTEQLRINVI
ncbi:MAG: tetratricopeptide repeat protein [Pseudomonadales bacterium]|nr:tetratricopeptide repeat protein [Pseudomonadales bacterium]